jgi:hypothetical protein
MGTAALALLARPWVGDRGDARPDYLLAVLGVHGADAKRAACSLDEASVKAW